MLDIIQKVNLTDSDRNELMVQAKALLKKVEIAEFKYNRTVMDKDAIKNVLNATIIDLENQKQTIEKASIKLVQQHNAIDQKNKELEETLHLLRSTQTQLVQSEKMASLGQLTAGVAHEINNPINFVSANINPLRDDLNDLLSCITLYDKIIADDDLEHHFKPLRALQQRLDLPSLVTEITELLNGIAIGASRTTEIVKGLRNFSRLDQNVLKKADVNEGLESTLVLLHSAYKDRITVIKELGSLPEIDCYPGQLNQVFMNILSNAIQAINAEGQITIQTSMLDNMVKISISDDGQGMTEVTKQKIFDPFFTTKDVGQGTGLGLSISYGIIEKHNGKIEVTSTLGQGTTFTITLPIINKQT